MNNATLSNVYFFDPACNINKMVDIEFHKNSIVGIKKNNNIKKKQKYLMLPALIDTYTDLSNLSSTSKILKKEADAAFSAGVESFFLTPSYGFSSLPKTETNILPVGGLTLDLQGEKLAKMASYKRQKGIALSNANFPIYNNKTKKLALLYAKSVGLPVIIAPQDPYLSEGGCVNDGPVATKLGLPAIGFEAETCDVATWIELVRATKCPVHFVNISSKHTITLIKRAKDDNLPVTCSVALPYLFLTQNDNLHFNSKTRLNPPLRSSCDKKALQQALMDGTIDIITSGHKPAKKEQTLAPFADCPDGTSGFDSFLPLLLKLVDDGILSLDCVVKATNYNPLKFFNLTTKRKFVLVKKIDYMIKTDNFHSCGKNSPFDGFLCHHKVLKIVDNKENVRQ
jgi:dihydroorotase